MYFHILYACVPPFMPGSRADAPLLDDAAAEYAAILAEAFWSVATVVNPDAVH